MTCTIEAIPSRLIRAALAPRADASLSTWLVTSVCSRRECTHSTVLYGSTHAEEICGHDQTVNEIFDFLP